MQDLNQEVFFIKPFRRLWQVVNLERKEIGSIYLYSILNGLLQLSVPLGIQAIINFALAGSLSTSMIVLIIAVVAAVFLTGLMQIGQLKIIEKIQQRIFARYALEFAWRLPKMSMQTVDKHYLPEVVNRYFDIISLQKSLSKLLLDIPVASIQILFGLLLLTLYANIFIIFGLLVIALLYLILYFSGTKGLKTSLKESDYKYSIASWLEEVARVLKSFRFSKGSTVPMEKADRLVANYLDARTAHFKILLLQYWALILIKVLVTAGMLTVGGILLVKNEINVGQFVASEIVILTVLASIEKFIKSLDKVYDLLTSLEKLGKVIDHPLERSGSLQLGECQEGIDIKVNDLSFSYGSQQVIQSLSFHIKAGQKVCLSGGVGSGKSTLFKLLSGAYDNFEGAILINEVPIGNYDPDSIRAQTGILLNQLDIFKGSLFENISLGNPQVKPDSIMAIAARIGLADFITGLNLGFDTEIEPMGRQLPQGVIKKILLLRALVASPSLLLLEEPWAGLDEESSQKIKNHLLHELSNSTCIVITNDQDFISRCHINIRNEKGKKAEVLISPSIKKTN
jgi:ABC-type bacteriocin/lantibiotic exporter with double-glycine peptidase domain